MVRRLSVRRASLVSPPSGSSWRGQVNISIPGPSSDRRVERERTANGSRAQQTDGSNWIPPAGRQSNSQPL